MKSLIALTTCLILSLASSSVMSAPLVIYDDALAGTVSNWSWDTTADWGHTTTVNTGSAAIEATITADWGSFYLNFDTPISTAEYDGIEFWIHGGATGGQELGVAVIQGGSASWTGAIATVNNGPVMAGSWTQVRIDFADAAISGTINGFWLADSDGGGGVATFYLDDVVATEGVVIPPTSDLAVNVDLDLDRAPIDDRVYGVNFGELSQHAELKFPFRRWGGNHTTRYSWEYDTANRALDWFFMNTPNDNSDAGTLPNGSASDVFIDETLLHQGEVLLTVPMIGWTPKERSKLWSCSVSKFGAQTETECTATGNASWCEPDAGSCTLTAGGLVSADPLDTSKAITETDNAAWQDHVFSRVGTASQGGVKYYSLDNEPMLWSSTHLDIHPAPLGYDELWQNTVAYGTSVKVKDPDAETFGPAVWGWCAYFWSDKDGCGPNAAADSDLTVHGEELLAWYLDQVCAHEAATGVKLVDYLDIHYYPQNGFSFSADDGLAALRFRALKSLYDPTYIDESWVPDAVQLVPRMKQLIADHCPDMKLAITEWRWGDDDSWSAAIAAAEVLAIFGREGVDVATRWVAPGPGTRVEDAYRLYLNYDGQGGRVTGDTVQAVSAVVDDVGSYAVHDPATDTMYFLLFNKKPQQFDVTVNTSHDLTGTGKTWNFTQSTTLAAGADVALTGKTFQLALPPYSATLVVADVVYAATGTGDGDSSPDAGADTGPDADAGAEVVAEVMADTATDAAAETMADTGPDAGPDAAPDTVADAPGPDAPGPDAAPDTSPDATPDDAPDAVTDAPGPDVVPDAVADAPRPQPDVIGDSQVQPNSDVVTAPPKPTEPDDGCSGSHDPGLPLPWLLLSSIVALAVLRRR